MRDRKLLLVGTAHDKEEQDLVLYINELSKKRENKNLGLFHEYLPITSLNFINLDPNDLHIRLFMLIS